MSSNSRLNKFERASQRQAILAQRMGGKGLYVFKNHTKGELMLPKPTASGQRRVAPGEEFQGDNYFMMYVRNNMLTLVREITSPDQEKQEKEQAILMEQQQKLLLEQPERVTTAGQTEQVVVQSKPAAKPLNENKGKGTKSAPAAPVLINEGPADLDGIEIVK